MIKILRPTLFLIFCLLSLQQSFAQFPYIESFRRSTANGIVFGGAPSAFLTAGGNGLDIATQTHTGVPIDLENQGYLRLTSNAKNQKGYIYSSSDFPSSNGLSLDLEYYSYGGSGADGISFFLFDATANPFVIGGFGGSLGYAQITTTTPVSPGVSKGYLAIGIDEYGNFSNNGEGRQGGFFGTRPGSVTLRGSGNGDALTPNNYRFLTTVKTSTMANDPFNLTGTATTRQPNTTSPGYRRVFIDLAPDPNGGYRVTVKITRGGTPTITSTVIDNYYYPDIAPAQLRYGIASSTGNQTNFHEIRNVTIDVYNRAGLVKPVADADLVNICSNQTAVIDVTANDKSTNPSGSIINASIDLDPAAAGIQSTYLVAGKGTFSISTTGRVEFTPSAAFSGPVTASYTVKDNYSVTSDPATITVNYIAPPTTPNAGTDAVVTLLQTPENYTLQANTVTSGTGKWSQVSGPSLATFVNINSNNTIAGNLLGGTYVFRWTTSSSAGCELSDDVQVVVNRRPVAVDDVSNTNLNVDIPFTILENDTDEDGNATINKNSIVIKSIPQNGALTVDPVAGLVIYRPNNGYTGSDSFTYTIKDNYGAESNVAIATIYVSLKPIGLPDASFTTTNTTISIPVIDNDPGKNGAMIIPGTDPVNGSIVINLNGTISYSPKTGFSGRDTFTYRLRASGGLESDPITVTVDVKPTGAADQKTTFTDVPVVVIVKDNDLSKTGTAVVVEKDPLNGTISINSSNEVTYTPKPGYSGKDVFTYRLRTPEGILSDEITVNIDVRPVGNPNEELGIATLPVAINVKDNDASKIGTTVIINTNPAKGTVSVNATTGIITFTPNVGFSGTDSFTYRLRTADGLESDPILVTLSSKPSGTADVKDTATGVPVTITVKDNDVSKTGTTVVLQGNPPNGTVALNPSGDPVYTPKAGFSGQDTFYYKLRDANGIESDAIPVTVSVKPIGSDDLLNGVGTTPVLLSVKDNDISKAGTTVVIKTDPAKGTVSVNASGVVTFTPNAGFTGTDVFTYVLRTAEGLDSDPITVTLSSKPLGSPDIANTNAGSPVAIPVKDNDASKTGTTVLIQTNPAKGTVAINQDGNPVYTPNLGTSGKDVFTYKLSGLNGVESDPIQVTVNVKPVGTADNKSTPVNTTVTFDIKSNDASKDGTTVILNTDPAHGTVTFNGLNATFIPANGYIGSDSFTYLLRTADGLESAPIAVNLTITPAIPAPNITIEAPIEKTTLIDIPIPPGGSYEITVPPAHGTITTDPVTGKPVYTPNPGYTGPDEFTYIIKDGNGNTSNPGKVNLTIYKPAKIGIAKALTSNVYNQDGSSRLNFLFTLVNYGDAVIDRVSLTDNLAAAFPGRTITINRINGSGTLKINNDYNGTSVTNMLLATSTLAANFKEVVELEITLSAAAQGGTFNNSATAQGFSAYDGSTTTDISTTGLTPDPVTPGDVTPQTPTQVVILLAPNLNVPASSGQPVTIPVPVPQGGSVIITRQPTNGTITFDPVTGQPIYTPKPGYSGPDDFTYVIRDPNGNISPQGTVTITVTLPAKIGLAKKLASQVKNLDGSYNLRFLFTMVNTGDFAIDRISLTEDLALAFPETTFQVVNVTTTSTTLRINPAFNGLNNRNLLLPASTINAQFKEEVTLELKIVLDKREGLFNNFANVEGFSTNDGSQLNDRSTEGSNPDPFVPGDFSPAVLTPITLEKGTFKIPAGFSPNNDGINDFFIIENVIGKKIQLEVFNRWGNRIFRATDYQNNWSGKSTEGIHLGEDVPVGTYYYIITIDGKDKRVGYITINR